MQVLIRERCRSGDCEARRGFCPRRLCPEYLAIGKLVSGNSSSGTWVGRAGQMGLLKPHQSRQFSSSLMVLPSHHSSGEYYQHVNLMKFTATCTSSCHKERVPSIIFIRLLLNWDDDDNFYSTDFQLKDIPTPSTVVPNKLISLSFKCLLVLGQKREISHSYFIYQTLFE